MCKISEEDYHKGVALSKKAMEALEKQLHRVPGIEKGAEDIRCFDACRVHIFCVSPKA